MIRNILTMAPKNLGLAAVTMTLFRREVVYRAK
jgi:hypothetical protein